MRPSLLIVEKDEEERKSLEDALFQVGLKYKMLSARTGDDTFKLLDELRDSLPKLIIMDSEIPKTTGMEILQKLATNYGVQVILYCTYCTPAVNEEAKSSGAIDCFKKGTSYADNFKFAKKVAEILRDNS